MSPILSNEFKIALVQACRALCQKFPKKQGILLNFLSGMLRAKSGLDYKVSIADTIVTVTKENPKAKKNWLAHLCRQDPPPAQTRRTAHR